MSAEFWNADAVLTNGHYTQQDLDCNHRDDNVGWQRWYSRLGKRFWNETWQSLFHLGLVRCSPNAVVVGCCLSSLSLSYLALFIRII
jgi:hypothetical protein